MEEVIFEVLQPRNDLIFYLIGLLPYPCSHMLLIKAPADVVVIG